MWLLIISLLVAIGVIAFQAGAISFLRKGRKLLIEKIQTKTDLIDAQNGLIAAQTKQIEILKEESCLHRKLLEYKDQTSNRFQQLC